MSYLCPHCNSFPMEDYVWWVSGGKQAYKLVVCDLWRKNMTGSWWCSKQVKGVNQAKVFKGMQYFRACGNLINALKLLANQQEDGDGLIQNIVTNLCEVSRKGLAEGFRNFKQVDNHRALEVGHLREGMVPLRYEGRKEKKGTQRCLSGKAPTN